MARTKNSAKKNLADSYKRYVKHMMSRIKKGVANWGNIVTFGDYRDIYTDFYVEDMDYQQKYKFEKDVAKECSVFKDLREAKKTRKLFDDYGKKSITTTKIVGRDEHGKPITETITYDLDKDFADMKYSHGEMIHITIAIRVANGEKRESVLEEYGYK